MLISTLGWRTEQSLSFIRVLRALRSSHIGDPPDWMKYVTLEAVSWKLQHN